MVERLGIIVSASIVRIAWPAEGDEAIVEPLASSKRRSGEDDSAVTSATKTRQDRVHGSTHLKPLVAAIASGRLENTAAALLH
jgi:hypothetical protein